MKLTTYNFLKTSITELAFPLRLRASAVKQTYFFAYFAFFAAKAYKTTTPVLSEVKNNIVKT